MSDDRTERLPILGCARCGRPNSALAYLSDCRHYCRGCAIHVSQTRGLADIGERARDLHV